MIKVRGRVRERPGGTVNANLASGRIELLAQEIEAKSNLKVERRFYLAGSYISHQALISGRIDAYVEYTGTALAAILKEPPMNDSARVFERVKQECSRRDGVAVLRHLLAGLQAQPHDAHRPAVRDLLKAKGAMLSAWAFR